LLDRVVPVTADAGHAVRLSNPRNTRIGVMVGPLGRLPSHRKSRRTGHACVSVCAFRQRHAGQDFNPRCGLSFVPAELMGINVAHAGLRR
jgi:hypothetical protein